MQVCDEMTNKKSYLLNVKLLLYECHSAKHWYKQIQKAYVTLLCENIEKAS